MTSYNPSLLIINFIMLHLSFFLDVTYNKYETIYIKRNF